MANSAPSQTVRFATFEVDFRSGELRKNGIKIKLQEKPFRVLALLLEGRGETLTREELRAKLWPADTFVDFDHSLATAIAKLRQALGDSAQNPRFVETVSNRGYRFLVPVDNSLPSQHSADIVERRGVDYPDDRGQGRDFRKGLERFDMQVAPAILSQALLSGWLAAGVLLIAFGIVSFVHFRERPPAAHLLRYTLALPENTTNIHSFAISPDGRYVAIAAVVDGKRQLWLRALDALHAQAMPGTEDAVWPFWSPDNRNIGFFGQGKLKKIAVSGGPPQPLCDAPSGRGGSWNREDMIVFSPSGSPGVAIQRVSAAGGVPADVTGRKGRPRFPVFLPDGRHFLYEVSLADQSGVYLASLDGKQSRRVLADESRVVFAAGRLLFLREKTLMAQPFDPEKGQTTGEAFPVAAGVSSNAPVTASDTAMLLYETGGTPILQDSQMGWYDRSGKLLEAIGPPGRWQPAISPDEKSVVLIGEASPEPNGNGALWVRDLARGTEQRLTTGASDDGPAFWSPKADRLVFASNHRGGSYDLYLMVAGGNGQDEPLLENGHNKNLTQWSHDGRFIVYTEIDPKTKHDIWVLPMDGGADRKPFPFLRSEFNEDFGVLSPDSHWMAYTSDETGQREVYVRPFPAGQNRWRISLVGGEQPRWRGDGKELFFMAPDAKMMAVAVKAGAPPGLGTQPTFEPGVPQALFETRLARLPVVPTFEYDITADAKHFLLNTVAGSAAEQQLIVVSNWDAGLKK